MTCDPRTTPPPETVVASWEGFCPICCRATRFIARNAWFRDHLICETCDGGSIPRERALMVVINQLLPLWAQLDIHESSPTPRGVSKLLAAEAPGYIATQFWPDVPPGESFEGTRCENLEAQTFAAESFDLVITQDVMEHIFHPQKAHQEIYRTLRPGGYHIHTAPIYKDLVVTEQRARLEQDGQITHLAEPEYHGNPISGEGSLVTFHYGYDIADLIAEWSLFDVEVRRFNDRTHGVVAEFSEVIICAKPG
jgi:SAM-dependent methyltransferase